MPSGPREIAVGPKTSEQLGLAIGDSVSLADPDLPDGGREAVVVGEVLMPTQDDNAFNEGVVLTPDALAAVAETGGFDQVVVTFAEGIDRSICTELVVHGWDLARATGQDDRIDPAEIARVRGPYARSHGEPGPCRGGRGGHRVPPRPHVGARGL